MNFDFLYHYDQMKKNELLLSYKGNMCNEFFTCMIQMVEYKLKNTEQKYKTKKKIFHILVEILQNIYHYVEQVNHEDYDSNVIFMLTKSEDGYFIFTGNHIKNESVDELKERIDQINSLDKASLVSLYRKRLRYGAINKNGGAGLGIMDIVRKSGTKINYDIKKVNHLYSFFSINIKVS